MDDLMKELSQYGPDPTKGLSGITPELAAQMWNEAMDGARIVYCIFCFYRINHLPDERTCPNCNKEKALATPAELMMAFADYLLDKNPIQGLGLMLAIAGKVKV